MAAASPSNNKNEKNYQSKLDLDFGSFMSKEIDRCSDCGDIYYASSGARPHLCISRKMGRPASPKNEPADILENFEMDRLNVLLGIKPILEKTWFHNEIYSAWKKNNFRRHPRPQAADSVANSVLEDDRSPAKSTFSFSPYDNYF